MDARRARADDDPAPPLAGGGSPVGDVLESVPFRHRLSTKLFGVTAVLALSAIAAIWFAERRIQAGLVDQLERSTALLGEAIQTSSQQAMLEPRPAHAYEVLARIGALEGIERVRVLDKRGRVVFSTRPADVGTTVAENGRACVACHGSRTQPISRAPASERAELLDAPDGHALSLVSPIHNARQCSTAACHVHPPGRQVLGLLELRVSLEHLESDVLAFRRGFFLVLAGAVVVLAALLYLFGRAEVVEPVAALVAGTRRVARDQLDLEIRVISKGELGLLATSFNEMTRSLRWLENDLQDFMAGLESQVEARTADLRAAQETLVRAEKMSSLGKLSASIAHEINNPLAGILTFAKLVSRTLAEGPPDDARRAILQKNLALIERETQRCSAIVRNLLSFARERAIQPKPMDPRARSRRRSRSSRARRVRTGSRSRATFSPCPPCSRTRGSSGRRSSTSPSTPATRWARRAACASRRARARRRWRSPSPTRVRASRPTGSSTSSTPSSRPRRRGPASASPSCTGSSTATAGSWT